MTQSETSTNTLCFQGATLTICHKCKIYYDSKHIVSVCRNLYYIYTNFFFLGRKIYKLFIHIKYLFTIHISINKSQIWKIIGKIELYIYIYNGTDSMNFQKVKSLVLHFFCSFSFFLGSMFSFSIHWFLKSGLLTWIFKCLYQRFRVYKHTHMYMYICLMVFLSDFLS